MRLTVPLLASVLCASVSQAAIVFAEFGDAPRIEMNAASGATINNLTFSTQFEKSGSPTFQTGIFNSAVTAIVTTSFDTSEKLELDIRQLSGNLGQSLQVDLGSGFGAWDRYVFDTSGLSGTTFQTIQSTTTIANPTTSNGVFAVGTDNITFIRIRSNDTGPELDYRYAVRSLAVVPEPSQLALIIGVASLALVGLRRR